MAKAHTVFFAVIATAVMLAQPAIAAALTSVAEDSVGDAVLFNNAALPGPAYLDIIKAAITLKGKQFTFVLDLAAPIPDRPVLLAETIELNWGWALNTDSTTFPKGCPFAPSDPRPSDFIVFVRWDGNSFAGFVIDRRPERSCSEETTPVTFSVKGAEVTLSADSALLGYPPTFTWWSHTRYWLGPMGTESEFTVDTAPNTPFGGVWPS